MSKLDKAKLITFLLFTLVLIGNIHEVCILYVDANIHGQEKPQEKFEVCINL